MSKTLKTLLEVVDDLETGEVVIRHVDAPPVLPPSDPHADLEALDLVALDEERRRLYTKAANEFQNLSDDDLGRLTRCNSIMRRKGGTGPPASPKKPNAQRRAAALPADLSDVPL